MNKNNNIFNKKLFQKKKDETLNKLTQSLLSVPEEILIKLAGNMEIQAHYNTLCTKDLKSMFCLVNVVRIHFRSKTNQLFLLV